MREQVRATAECSAKRVRVLHRMLAAGGIANMSDGERRFKSMIGDETDPNAIVGRLWLLHKKGITIAGQGYSPTVAVMP